VAPVPDGFDAFSEKLQPTVSEYAGWSAEEVRAMVELLPHGQLAVLPGATHNEVTRRGEQVLAAIRPFLTS